jgi:nucleotide-binding universal stress UspA family protein
MGWKNQAPFSAGGDPMFEPFQRILCAIDFSETSDLALKHAERLAAASGAEVVLLHAFDLPGSYDYPGQTRPADPKLRERVEKLLPTSANVKFRHVLHAGLAGEVICWLAEDQKCDLIVMGTHGRTGLKHLIFGSVAEHVLQHARCPVLVVRKRPANEPRLTEPIVLPPPPPRLM